MPDGQRQAQFVCVITLVTPDGKVIQARGEVHGELLRAPAGSGGFGYDPIFHSEEADIDFGLASEEIKNRFSHRGKAIAKLVEYLSQK